MNVCVSVSWIHTLLLLGVRLSSSLCLFVSSPLALCGVCVCVHLWVCVCVRLWLFVCMDACVQAATVCGSCLIPGSSALSSASPNPAETVALLPPGTAAGPRPSFPWHPPNHPPNLTNICSVCFSFLPWHWPSFSTTASLCSYPFFSAVISKGNLCLPYLPVACCLSPGCQFLNN